MGNSAIVDFVFPLAGRELPRDHRMLLATALADVLPWLASDREAAVHPVNVVHGTGESALLAARSLLVLRLRRERASALEPLSGRWLHVGASELLLGAPQVRELLPHATLYAHFVDAGDAGEVAFLDAIGAQLDRLDVSCHRVCGREQRLRGPGQPLHGFSLMLHGLRAQASLSVLEHGLGEHRLMGCGVFVPHKSAAAVGD